MTCQTAQLGRDLRHTPAHRRTGGRPDSADRRLAGAGREALERGEAVNGSATALPGRDNGAMAGEVVRCGHCGKANRVPAAAAGTPRCGKCHQPLPWIADADDATFGEVAAAAKIPVVVDLWAPWCGPCRMVSPALEQLARDLAGKVKLVKVNVDTSPQISQRFGVQAIPTLLVLRHGQVAARQTGAVPLATLRAWVDNALAVG
jgi:thioredoxin 2